MYYFACDDMIGPKLVTGEMLKVLSDALEQHASYEYMAEWACRFVHRLMRFDHLSNVNKSRYQGGEVSTKMRSAGINEMVTSAVQRQAISKVVSSVGCLAIGDLARDPDNHTRLTSSGASEAAVGALKRHINAVDVAYNSCYAIHFLCNGFQNSVSWMGANGACEAVTSALEKHSETSLEVARFASNALGSLAFKDEGNQKRIHAAGGCQAIATALTIHLSSAEVAESTCRAIFNLCADTNNLTEFGRVNACSLVVSALKTHSGDADVCTQALLAICGLAVKEKLDKVHKGNTRKLVENDALEMVLAVTQQFADNAIVQKAAAMAIAALSRLDINREKLGLMNATTLMANALKTHISQSDVVTKIALAIDTLATNSEANKDKFAKSAVVEDLLVALQKHEKDHSMVAECFRAFVTFTTTSEVIRSKIFVESVFKLMVKLMKLHEKHEKVAVNACQLLYAATTTNPNRALLGSARACETTVSVLNRHGEKSAKLAEWASKAMVGLSLLDNNKEKFHNHDSCVALVKALQTHYKDEVVAEWSTAAICSIAVFPQNRVKLGSAGVCAALQMTLTSQQQRDQPSSHDPHDDHLPPPPPPPPHQKGQNNIQNDGSERIAKLVCEAVFELAQESTNQAAFLQAGMLEVLVTALQQSLNQASMASDICRAIYSLALNNAEAANRFFELGCLGLIATTLEKHQLVPSTCQWTAAAVAALCGHGSGKNGSGNRNSNRLTGSSIAAGAAKLLGLGNSKGSPSSEESAPNSISTSPNSNAWNSNQTSLISLFDSLGQILQQHFSTATVIAQAARALRSLSCYYPDYIPHVSRSTILPSCIALIKAHVQVDHVVEHCAWLLGNIEYKPAAVHFLAEQTASAPVTTQEFYQNQAHWDTLYTSLQTHRRKRPATLRWICGAIAKFADKGKLIHSALCDALAELLAERSDDDLLASKVLTAIGSLARCHPENQNRLSDDDRMVQEIDGLFGTYVEGSSIVTGLLASIAGLAENNAANQQRIAEAKNILSGLLQILYNELETEAVSQLGCTAIAALIKNHDANQAKLGSASTFIADVILTHYKTNAPIAVEACKAISFLAHKSISLRNKLGANDSCSAVMTAAETYVNDHVVDSWVKYEKGIIYWACRAIADLAANNPNNQAKLGAHGACEFLVKILRQRKSNQQEKDHEAKVFAVVFWAMGNLVQIGAKGASLDQVVSAGTAASSTNNLNAIADNNNNTTANTGNNTPVPPPPSTPVQGLGARSSTMREFGKQASMLMGGAAGPSTANMKNTARFNNADAASELMFVATRYVEYPETTMWACRAVTNLSKSQRLREALLDASALGYVQGIIEKYRDSTGPGHAEVNEWVGMARDMLVTKESK
jgi:hypothetical protein